MYTIPAHSIISIMFYIYIQVLTMLLIQISYLYLCYLNYIIPIPGLPAGIAGSSFLIVATTDSVVSNVEATLVAFCNALLVTFAGSRIPAVTILQYGYSRYS